MKKTVLAVFLSLLALHAFAITKTSTQHSISESINSSLMRCNGIDGAGDGVYLFSYANSSVVNINGDLLTIVGLTRNGRGVVTQNFINVYGMLVYDSLVPVGRNNLTIFQFNAITEHLLGQAFLSCGFYETSSNTMSVFDHKLFDAIQSNSMNSTSRMPYNRKKAPEDQ